MPTYQYACSKCGHEFELFQSMKDTAIETCPKDKCGRKTWGKGKVQRQVGTGAGLIFKGSGFYTTDYRSENYKAAAKKESTASGSSSSSTPSSTPTPTPGSTSSKSDSGAAKSPPAATPKPKSTST